jgi:hypothetical protein
LLIGSQRRGARQLLGAFALTSGPVAEGISHIAGIACDGDPIIVRLIIGDPLIQPDDLRRGRDDVAFVIGRQEETVGDPGGVDVPADEDVRPVAVSPDRPDFHLEQVTRRAEGMDHLFTDEFVKGVAQGS